MPELPEVETIRRQLEKTVVGRCITGITIQDPSCLAGCPPSLLHGRRIIAARRRGKFLLLDFDPSATLVIHLRMTGSLLLSPASVNRPRLTLHTPCETVVFNDTRRLGTAWVGEGGAIPGSLSRLGPEPFDPAVDSEWLKQTLSRRSAPIKSVLLDQTVIAGLGNIYADEILWSARVHPLRRAQSLSRRELGRLLSAMRSILGRALKAGGTTISDFRNAAGERGGFSLSLSVYRRTGMPCPRCGAAIERMVVGGRGTHYCSCCQDGKRRFDNPPEE